MARYNVDLQDNEGNAYQIMANPDSVAEFSPAVNRENIRSGETYRVIFGKIMKYLSEVGNAAYVGLANNCTTTIAGFALDARQGKELMDRINELNRDMGGKLPVLNYNITLSDDASVHAQKALRYLFTDAEAIKHTSFMFNILVNNADFYSGTCYTDGGNTAWGDINKRGSEADPGSVWKWVTFNFKTGGADPVLKKLDSSAKTISFTLPRSQTAVYTVENIGLDTSPNFICLSVNNNVWMQAIYDLLGNGDSVKVVGYATSQSFQNIPIPQVFPMIEKDSIQIACKYFDAGVGELHARMIVCTF